jgi:hypothetical protein
MIHISNNIYTSILSASQQTQQYVKITYTHGLQEI